MRATWWVVTTNGGQFVAAAPTEAGARAAAVPVLVDAGRSEDEAKEQVARLPIGRVTVDTHTAQALRSVVVSCCVESGEVGGALLDELGMMPVDAVVVDVPENPPATHSPPP